MSNGERREPVQVGAELHREIEESFTDFLLNRPYNCGFNPNDEDADRKAEIDLYRSKILRCMFITEDFANFVTAASQEVLQHELNYRWNNGESLNGEEVEELRHTIRHVATDLLERLSVQAIEPFIATLVNEDRYSRNAMYPEHDFKAAVQPPQE